MWSYRLPRTTILDTIAQLLTTTGIVVQSAELVQEAIDDARTGRGDFADYLIGAVSRSEGCSATFTLDGALARHPNFRLVKPV